MSGGERAVQSAEKARCICPQDYCLDDSADPDSCPACAGLDPYEPCPTEVCPHEWLDRPESDTHECLICGVEGSGPPPRQSPAMTSSGECLDCYGGEGVCTDCPAAPDLPVAREAAERSTEVRNV